jgi:hypothetical protein
MISPELRFEGFDVESWTNLVGIFSPGVVERMENQPATSDAPQIARGEAAGGRGALIIVLDRSGRVLKAHHTSHGRIVDLPEWTGPQSLPELARAYGAVRALVLAEGAADEMAERLSLRLQRGDDYATQWLAFARIFREMQEAGQVHVFPNPVGSVPVPSPGTVRRALDILLPDDHSVVLTVWSGETPYTTVALRRRRGAIDRVVGPDLITRWVGPLGGDFRRDHRVIVEAVSHALAPVHVGLFSQKHTLEELLRASSPGVWAQAAAVRDVIVYPTPPYLAIALGADAVRGVTDVTRRFLGGIDFFAAVTPLTDMVRSRVSERVSEVASVTQTLGFDPLTVLSAWLRRDEIQDPAETDNRDD